MLSLPVWLPCLMFLPGGSMPPGRGVPHPAASGSRGDPRNQKSERYASYWNVFLLPPATKLGQGYVFTGVCDSVNRGEGVWDTTPGQTPPPELCKGLPPDYVLPLELRTPGLRTPRDYVPPRGRSMCGRYASYWNAFLFAFFLPKTA